MAPETSNNKPAPRQTPRPGRQSTESPKDSDTVAKPGFRRRWGSQVNIAAFTVFIIGICAIVLTVVVNGSHHAATPTTAHAGSTRTANPHIQTVSSCPGSWKMIPSPTNGNWVTKGVPAIQDAKTPRDAANAAYQWIVGTGNQPGIMYTSGPLAGAVASLLHQQVDPRTLVSADGCASGSAVTFANEILVDFSMSTITPGIAPSSGMNSGTTSNGTIEQHPGMPNDRRAIKIVMPDGTTLWVLGVCGNVVTPVVPPSSTPPPSSPPQCQEFSIMQGCLSPKSTVPTVTPGISGPLVPTTSPPSQPTDAPNGCPQQCPGASPTPTPIGPPPSTPSPLPPIQSNPPTATPLPQPTPFGG